MCTVTAVMIDNYGCIKAVTSRSGWITVTDLDRLFNHLDGLCPPRRLKETVSLVEQINNYNMYLFYIFILWFTASVYTCPLLHCPQSLNYLIILVTMNVRPTKAQWALSYFKPVYQYRKLQDIFARRNIDLFYLSQFCLLS